MNVQQQTAKTNPTKTISHTVDKAIVPHAVVDAVMIIAQSATMSLLKWMMKECVMGLQSVPIAGLNRQVRGLIPANANVAAL